MSEKNTLLNNSSQPSVHRPAESATFLSKPYTLALLTFIILSLLFSLLIYQRYELATEDQQKEAYEIINLAKDKLQEALTHSLSATKTLTFFIDNNGHVNNFDSIASQILASGNDIDALQLVPDGIIQYVYPLQGNEKVIGYNILQDPARNKEAYKAIEKKQMFFAGPLELRQGGMGVVGRLPVYRNDKFWGFSAVIIKMSTLFKTAGIDSTEKKGYYFQLSKINPDTKEEEYFLPKLNGKSGSHSVSVNVPNGEWKLSVNVTRANRNFGDISLLALLGVLLSFFGALFVYRVAEQPKKLKELVKNRTKELEASKNRYMTVIERVSDAFVAIDKDWIYTYVNEKAGEMFSRDPQSLIGKNIWSEFPEGINQPFYYAYYRAMNLQEYQYLEEYYPSSDKWFESHIYPSKDGLTIFFKDVSDIKKISLALKQNEEKYRSLIEQASDGIVITDMEGIILEVNNSITKMIGFSNDEMIGHHLMKYLPEDDINTLPLRINELMQGKSLLYERRLIKKDGTILDVEINSKMASTHTLIGFIRDITERKKAEEALRKSNERFELIAEATNDAIWDHDFIKNETWGNNKLYDLYGVKPGSMKINFQMFMDHIHPDERAAIEENLKSAIENGDVAISETFRFRTESGDYRTFFDRAHIKYDKSGNPERILGAMQNITESKEAQKAIQESEEKFRAIIEQASDGIFLSDENTYFIDVNSAGCRMTGYSLDELKKIKFLDIIPPVDLINNPVKIANMKPGASVVNERRLVRKDGVVIDVEISAKKLLDGRFQSFARDITERKKAAEKLQHSEEKYRLLFYDNPLPMYMTTLPGLDIIDVNDAAIKQYGYSREEFLKLNTRQLRPAEDVKYFLEEVNKMHPGIINVRNWRHKKKDGTVIYVETYSHEILYEGKRAWLGLSHDVTEKNEAKMLLQKSYDEIRQLASNLQSIREDERTNIAREIHDELGQQLTGLKMDLHWLTRKISTDDKAITIKMQESIDLINATIASVRKISTDLRPSILDDLGLLAALEWQGNEFEKRSGTKVIFINKVGDITVEPEAATGIFRIYQELLTNIARHANASLVRAILFKDDNQMYFSVNDNGVGFDLETIANKKTLGLLGIKERSLLLGGTYEFKSKPGEGSVTTISIPLILIKITN